MNNSMNSIELKAYAKINLGLDVTGRRDDGYHLVRMVMQTVDIFDVLKIKKRDDDRITFSCTDPTLETDDNLCVKAAKLFQKESGLRCGVDIFLEKNNPVAAGMGGGSTDAAAVLRGMNEIFAPGLLRETLYDIALKIGADVPFCIKGGCALCEGIGEVLTPISGMRDIPVLIARPDVQVSTAGIYTKLDAIGDFKHPDIDGMIKAVESGDMVSLGAKLGNVLEAVTAAEVDVISLIESIMIKNGALGSRMTGSGPTVFGLFPDEDTLLGCMQEIRDKCLCSFLKGTHMIQPTESDALA